MEEEIQRADSKHRSRILVVLLVFVVAGLALLRWGLPAAYAELNRLDPETALRVIEAVLVLLFLGLIPFGLYLGRLGRRAVDHERFPPPGTRVVRDVPVLRGEKARRRGKALSFFSWGLIVLAVAAALFVHFMIQALKSSA